MNTLTPFARIHRILLALALAALPVLAAPEADQVRVATVLTPADAKIETTIRMGAGPAGSRYLEISLGNASGTDIALAKAEVDFPWVASSGRGFLISSGATVMGDWPERVFDPAQGGADAESGTYLLARQSGGFSLVGFLTWRAFWSKLRYESGRVVATADGEGRLIRPGETVALEKIWLAENPDWQDLLFAYADEIASELRIKLKPPHEWVGWSTWDYYGRTFTSGQVIANLDALLKLAPNSNLLQIDGGWWRFRGDYDRVGDSLGPDGMKGLAAQIRAKGLTAGIHLDSIRASSKSVVAREHPEYFLDDRTGAPIADNYERDLARNLYFDFSSPGACGYMRDALRLIRRDWGFEYFKIDYLSSGIGEVIRKRALNGDPGREIVPHDRHFTSIERLHLSLAAFREGIGPDAYLLGCSAPFGPVFGHVDGLRTGPDIAPNFAQFRRCCEATAGCFYLQGKVVTNDTDYQVGRAREDEDGSLVANPAKSGGSLALNEAEMWADYVALFSGMKVSSDDLLILRKNRKTLFQFAAGQPGCSRFVPLDYWQHGRDDRDACHVFLGVAGGRVFLGLFNWSDESLTYSLSGLSHGEAGAMTELRGSARFDASGPMVRISLPARHSSIFLMADGTDFDRARRAIAVE